jgi:hypothetical protein
MYLRSACDPLPLTRRPKRLHSPCCSGFRLLGVLITTELVKALVYSVGSVCSIVITDALQKLKGE